MLARQLLEPVVDREDRARVVLGLEPQGVDLLVLEGVGAERPEASQDVPRLRGGLPGVVALLGDEGGGHGQVVPARGGVSHAPGQ